MTAAAFPSGRPRSLRFLPRFLFSPEGGAPAYVVKAWLLALLPSLAIGAAIAYLTSGEAGPEFRLPAPLFMLLVVAVAPLLETLIMIPPLLGLARLAGPGRAAIGSAFLWALFHSLAQPLWGLVVWWPFLILSVALLTWRQRGIGTAILVVTVIHMLQNAVAAALPYLLGLALPAVSR
ncbi:MAG TPA: hypothetical protein VF704_09025 [Allosphingosinicella sp.]|jgi:membrane protease YdiL (CAAX protease family)